MIQDSLKYAVLRGWVFGIQKMTGVPAASKTMCISMGWLIINAVLARRMEMEPRQSIRFSPIRQRTIHHDLDICPEILELRPARVIRDAELDRLAAHNAGARGVADVDGRLVHPG
jgi:hypothetical protein